MAETAKRVAIATLVAGGIVVVGVALWRLRLVVGLLFSAVIIAAALRPGARLVLLVWQPPERNEWAQRSTPRWATRRGHRSPGRIRSRSATPR